MNKYSPPREGIPKFGGKPAPRVPAEEAVGKAATNSLLRFHLFPETPYGDAQYWDKRTRKMLGRSRYKDLQIFVRRDVVAIAVTATKTTIEGMLRAENSPFFSKEPCPQSAGILCEGCGPVQEPARSTTSRQRKNANRRRNKKERREKGKKKR